MLPPVYLKAYCRPLKACNFYFSTDQLKHLQKIWQLQKKKTQVKITSRSNVMPVFVFSR